MTGAVSPQQLEAQARRAAQQGREAEAAALWSQLLEQSPENPAALAALGEIALRRGERAQARALLARAANSAPGNLMVWINLAMACRACGDQDGEAAAVNRALVCDPMDLIALIMKARILDGLGQVAEAARVHAAVLAVAPPPERLSSDLRAAVAHSRKRVEAKTRSLEAYLDQHISVPENQRPPRFNESLNILLGKQKRYSHEPTLFYYPGLAPIYFFDRAQFPWLAAFEEATDEIRQEFLRVHAEDRGFSPYIAYPPGTCPEAAPIAVR